MIPENLPEPPPLFMFCMPVVFGGDYMTYAPGIAAASRSSCWDKALKWADESCDSAHRFRWLYKQSRAVSTPQTQHHLAVWAEYDRDATRDEQMAWLRRRGCRVVAGRFIPKQEQVHADAS